MLLKKPEDNVPRIMEGTASFDISGLEIKFDTSTLKHDVLVPMFTKMLKSFIKHQIENQVENNLKGFMKNLGDMVYNSLVQTNRPFLSGLKQARKAVISSEFGQIYEKRREKLE